ncbi:hypothetical protein M011DRAFT_474405 [Sporormia fimetaria CBS 119925]|uniref:GRF-type domain-containing protein n=1 Tax=Sporormia fimetaria CBS 119925 TaxID=1340428 RepID=A0A6A6VM84_9PLEO|nr:hypothetical protein M011DRAFT_474405 [Sporormia fimetaria CBS 119925]
MSYKWRGGRGSARKPQTTRGGGLLINGVWHCDCNPRLPALHLQTKKPGPNTGRWFYTCQGPQDDTTRCNSFLWDSDAKTREERALINNSRSETELADRTPSRPTRTGSPPPPYNTKESDATPTNKRKRPIGEQLDEFGFGLDDSSLDDELRALTEETPSKSKVARNQLFSTPGSRNPGGDSGTFPTPHTASRPVDKQNHSKLGNSLVTPSRNKPTLYSSQSTLPSNDSPAVTPTPSRIRAPGTPHAEDALFEDVFNLLKEEDVHLPPKASTALTQLLGKYVRRAEGVNKSKEVLRLRIKAEEAKNVELSHRSNTLQAELEAAKATIDHLKWERENGEDS